MRRSRKEQVTMMHVLKRARGWRSASPQRARRALVIGGTTVGALAMTAAMAAPAGATVVPPYNNVLIGSGSSTTYNLMQQMDVLFNSAPGCQTFVAFPAGGAAPTGSSEPNGGQQLDYSCEFPPTKAPSTNDATGSPENPYNDVSVQESPLGSSNGIEQVELGGAHGATYTDKFGNSINDTQNQNYGRSSRALSSGDLQGLNFVAYASDGVTWFAFNEVAGTPSAANGLNDVSSTTVKDIWNGTVTNWDQVCNTSTDPFGNASQCGADAPIVVFSAQEGSGTQGTWKTYMGYDPSAATNQVNCYTPSGGSNTCVGPAVIFENEDAQIRAAAFNNASQSGFTSSNNPAWGGGSATDDDIMSDAVFFYSAGKYNLQCKSICGGSTLPASTTNFIGSVNDEAPNEANILDGAFPFDRYIYNVYSNGSNSNIPAATAATLNYVSEQGFICNPNKANAKAEFDPNTGRSYLSEIQRVIENAGFYPLSGGAASGTVNGTPIDEGKVGNPASALLAKTSGGQAPGQTSSDPGYAQYSPFDTVPHEPKTSGGDPKGYCLVTTTDGNSNS
ncbi:MAG: substrate-binding domain-containing protein [Acidimicrobiales bacterium]